MIRPTFLWVRVENPSILPVQLGGVPQLSNIAGFTIAPASAAPNLNSLSTPSVLAGSPAITLTAAGCNFTIGYQNIGPASIAIHHQIVFDGTAVDATYNSSNSISAPIPALMLQAARTVEVRVRNRTSLFGNGTDSAPLAFAVLAPAISGLSPASIAPMDVASPPVQVVVTGTGFLASSVIHANGTPLPTTWVSATELRADVGPSIPQALLPGGIAINVANNAQAVSNTPVLVVGSGANQGTIRRHPLNPAPGEAYAALVENGAASSPFSLSIDLENPTPLLSFPDPAANLVCAVFPASSGAQFFPLVEGIGIHGPASGVTLGADGGLGIPGFVAPNPPVGISLTLQGIYLDPTAPFGFNLTWARFPD